MLDFGISNVMHFVWHHNDSVDTILVQPKGHSHIFGLYSPNLVTDQDKIDAFMETIGNSVHTKEFDREILFGGIINFPSYFLQVENQHNVV